jgi:hypothetical protein
MGTKINTDMTLRMIKINQILTIDSITKKNIMEDKFFYNEEEWVKAIKKYSKSSIEEIEGAKSVGGPCCWTPDDFNYKKYNI